MSPPAPRSFGKYLLEREIARGGMARVHLATLRGLGGFEKRLVVKEVLPELASDPRFVAMFVEEAKVLVALSHPNIVPVYELGIVDGTYFLAMEHVEGATLADLVAARPLTPAEAARVGAEIADALAYAHERFEIVHRDVSPRNVMVDTTGHARLLDFGIAARADVGESEGDALYGTPGFLSPEQARGEKLAPASDLFSLGCVLAFAVSGKSPFGGRDVERLRALVAPPDVSIEGAPALGRIVRELLAPTPAARPASARAVARALASIANALEHEDESAGATLGARAREPGPQPVETEPSSPEAATSPVTPGGRIETLAKSQALDAMLGTARVVPLAPPVRATGWAGEETPGGGTARIERAPPALAPSRAPALGLAVVAAMVSAVLVWTARYELAATPPIDPVDHGLTAPADIAPLPIESEDGGFADDAAPAPVGDARAVDEDGGPGDRDAGGGEPGAVPPRARDAGARGSASLTVLVVPWAHVSVDGHVAGDTPLRRFRITAGSHVVAVSNEATGHAETRTIVAAPGETVELRFDLE